jgi:hypothetical protein
MNSNKTIGELQTYVVGSYHIYCYDCNKSYDALKEKIEASGCTCENGFNFGFICSGVKKSMKVVPIESNIKLSI